MRIGIHSHAGWLVAGLGLVAVACNSHLLVESKDPEVIIIDPPVVGPPPVQLDDAGLPSNPFGGGVVLGTLPDGATSSGGVIGSGGAAGAGGAKGSGGVTPDAARVPDAPPDLPPDIPPVENFKCPAGLVRVHFRDVWSSKVDPSMKTMTSVPMGVMVIDPSNWTTYGARVDAVDCSYYSVCLPSSVAKIQVKPIGADGCANSGQSGNFTISSLSKNPDIWIYYDGQSSTLQADYSASNVPTGTGKFIISSDADSLKYPPCEAGPPPSQGVPDGYTKVHFRWPWNDPTDPKTPYPGSGCPVASNQRDPVTKSCPFDLAKTVGFSVPPYPSSLKVTGLTCEMVAVLEFQDGQCPWYYVMIPNSAWPATGTTPKIVFRYPDESKNLYTNSIQLPPRTAKEYWIAYAGAPDNTIASGTCCLDWSLQTNSYFVYTENPGPGSEACGGATKPIDPCSPPQPSGYHTVHFRYLWAGQKTFSFFPKPSLMPKWIELEINGGPTGALKVICQREQDRPWFQCPVPDAAFSATTTWRAVDKLHDPEWNTVKAWPLPATPKEYWIRWYYGKPDIPRDKDPPNFKVFDYYPDGTNGDWSATGVWDDEMCAPKPPPTPVKVGFGNGAWFPYKRTQYMYPYGGSLAYIYPPENRTAVQDLFDAFVWERYQLWKQNWVREGNDACGAGTARVDSGGWPGGTVSEGQGYGIAIAAAIGDKDMVEKLWNFVRHFRSQSKYCGLMGWKWNDPSNCQALDSFASSGGTLDSAFDGDVDIAIGLVYAALQWPEYTDAATDWLVRMECEINAKYGDGWNYPTKGDTWDKNCQTTPCDYAPKTNSEVFMDYYPPGYFRVFGDFLAAHPPSSGDTASNGQTHKEFWYKTAETVWEMVERCYDQPGMHKALISMSGNAMQPCASVGGGEPYEWGRSLWRLGIDAAWFGNDTSLPENTPNSSTHYAGKSRIQAKIDLIQNFFTNFYKNNPPEPNTNRFSTICHQLGPAGDVKNCDPAYGHNSYTVNLALCPYVSMFDNKGETTSDIRREAIEESITTTVQNDQYFQESLGVYSIMFMTGNFPNPMIVPK